MFGRKNQIPSIQFGQCALRDEYNSREENGIVIIWAKTLSAMMPLMTNHL